MEVPKSNYLDDTNSQYIDLTSKKDVIFNTYYLICNKLIFEFKKKIVLT